MIRNRINVDETKDAILLFLHAHASKDTNNDLHLSEIFDAISRSNVVINIAIDALQSESLCTKYEIERSSIPSLVSGNPRLTKFVCVRITMEGINVIESWPDELYEETERKVHFPVESSQEKTDDQRTESNAKWEPIPIERNAPKFEAAVEATETALRTIEGNNGYADSEPEERKQIVWTIRTGLEALKSGFSTISQVREFLVAPFGYLAKKFADSAIGVAAKSAISALIDLIS